MKRFIFIDFAKSIGIYLVILGHLVLPPNVCNFIFAFHMPLFFFISGFLFFQKETSFGELIKNKAKTLLIPYIFFNIVTYFFWLFIGRKFGNDALIEISVLKPIFGILYGVGTGDFLVHNIALWFLPCLFCVEVIFFKLVVYKSIIYRYLIILILLFVGQLFSSYSSFRLPLSLDTSLVALLFFSLGYDLKKSKFFESFSFEKIYFLLFALVIICFYFLLFISNKNGKVDMNGNVYGESFSLFILGSFFGILLILFISFFLEFYFGKINIIEFISKNTLTIFSLHLIGLSLIKGVSVYIFKIPLNEWESNLIIPFFVSLALLLVLCIPSYLINKYLGILIGKF